MKIRTRLTYQFSVIVALIIIIFSVAVYKFSSNHRKNEFYIRLKEKAITIAKLYSRDVKEVDTTLLKIINKNSYNLLPKENVTIYNYNNKLLFKSNQDVYSPITKDLIRKVILYKEIRFSQDENEIIGILFKDGFNDKYVVVASAYDMYGLSKLNYLKKILIIGVFIAMVLIVVMGLIFSKQALSPISNIIQQAAEITGSNLAKRIDEGKGKDEIAYLAHTFNNMLDRIQKTFELQKSFVANSSHELRTPLTSITGQLEVALMNPRDPVEYRKVLNSVLEDIKDVNRLTNGLLELAHTDMDISRLKMEKIRIDELLWQSRLDLINKELDYKVNIEIKDVLDDDQKLIVFGDKYLLASAIFNVMENACKFSDNKHVDIILTATNNVVCLSFKNSGAGISKEDLKKIGRPFYRGQNAQGIEGHGIGLSLVFKIISQHFGNTYINSTTNEYTEVKIYLPSYKMIIDYTYI